MERLNNSIPQLQDSISSAFENVSAGIVENVNSSGIAGLDSTFEVFSDSNLIAGDFNSFQTVSEPAAYPDPSFSSQDVLKVLKDRNFHPEREIATLFPPGWDKIGEWANLLAKRILSDQLNSDRTIDGKLADGAARKQAKGPVSEFAPDPPIVVPSDSASEQKLLSVNGPGASLNQKSKPNNDKLGDLYSDSLDRVPNDEKKDNFHIDQSIDGKLADGAARKQAKGPVSDVVPDPPTAVPPSVIPPPQQTYFQTIDETALQMQTNPQPETAQVLQQQFTAVQEMTSAVKDTLQLFQQLNSNSLFNLR